MTTAAHPQGRVGAAHRAKLKKWSDKVALEDDARPVVTPGKRPAGWRLGTLDAAKEKLRKLFH